MLSVSSSPISTRQAIAEESEVSQKYLAFAKKADADGYKKIAILFRTAAAAERVHAEGHLAAMDGIGTTAQNLVTAIEGETYEFTQMYPPMIKQAETEGHKARRMFEYASKAEAVHAKLYDLALEAVQKGQDLPGTKIYLCPVCGDIEFGQPPETCPSCRAKGAQLRSDRLISWPPTSGWLVHCAKTDRREFSQRISGLSGEGDL